MIGRAFLDDWLQDDGTIPVKGIMFIAVYDLVLTKTIAWEYKLHYRCVVLKPD
jgi:hypothetical protein